MARGQPDQQQGEANRQRRLGDAAKLLPVLGAILMTIPALWVAGTSTSLALVYIFSVWGGMIVIIAVLSRALSRFVNRPEDRTTPKSLEP